MAHLTKPTKYDIKDSNIALLGSDLERHVREHAGDKESAWSEAGINPGLQIWRMEDFRVVAWPKERLGSFYDGDSYIVLHTYKKTPEAEQLSYDLHFWLGEDTTQDEAGTAAYKTVELDDHLQGRPVQFREVQGHESARFLSYFPRFVCLHGGVATGFHHVSTPLPANVRKLYNISFSRVGGRFNLLVREVAAEASNLVEGDVFVLDKGSQVWQYNTKASSGKGRFKAAEFVQLLLGERQGQSDLTVYDEGESGAGLFLSEFGENTVLADHKLSKKPEDDTPPTLHRLSDATGIVTFEEVNPPIRSSLSSADAFLLDNSLHSAHPAVYIWLGKDASLTERWLAVQYAQKYVYEKQNKGETLHAGVTLVKMNEGSETEQFSQIVGA